MITRTPDMHTVSRSGLPLLLSACLVVVPALQLPQHALAQSDCGAGSPPPASVTCSDTSQNPYDGITLETLTGLSLHVSSGIVIQRTEGADHDGVHVDGRGNDLLFVYLEDGVSISTRGGDSDGVQVHSRVGSSDIRIDSGANIDVVAPAPAVSSNGLVGWVSDPTSTGGIWVRQRAGSSINVTGQLVSGILTMQYGLGETTVVSDGVINASGASAAGIFAWVLEPTNNSRSVATLSSQGVIRVDGVDGAGIWADYAGLLASDIYVDGAIEASGTRTSGVLNDLNNLGAQTGTVSISGTGSILTLGDEGHGVRVTNGGSGASTISNDGSVRVLGQESVGLSIIAQGGTAEILSNGPVTASGQSGIGISSISEAQTSAVTVGAGSVVVGGWQPGAALGASPSAGVAIGSATGSTLTNRGSISAGSDRAIVDTSLWIAPPGATGPLTVTNSGTVTGFVDFGFAAGNLFENEAAGLFDIRHFADTDGDGVRDTKRVAISDFGDATSQFDNSGTVRLAPVVGAAAVDATSYYVPTTGLTSIPLSAAEYDFNRDGIVQAQMINLGT